jgi:translation initiation factor 1
VARLLGRGERQERHPTEAPAPERPTAKEPARKPVTLKVGRETAGRRGKGVTTVFDIPLAEDGVRELATLLKQRCGTGGTVKDGRIEIQGDQRERIVAELEKLGYKVRRVGG